MITVLFGPPGSGKGTQAMAVAGRFGLPHVSTGEMLRAEVEQDSELGREVAPIMSSGRLISDELMIRVIESRLQRADAAQGVLLDGFPRTVPQAQALDAMLKRGTRQVDLVLAFVVAEDVLRARILRRGEIEHRADDTADAFAQRMTQYHEETAPVLEHYAAEGTHIEQIQGEGTISEVTERIADAFNRSRVVPAS